MRGGKWKKLPPNRFFDLPIELQLHILNFIPRLRKRIKQKIKRIHFIKGVQVDPPN